MRKIVSLNDEQWRVGSVSQKRFGPTNDMDEVREWLPARVPGDARLDLLRAGKIPDPFYADNNAASQWIDGRDWWYVRELELAVAPGARLFLVLDGVDYQSAVYWNGVELGRHVGMFSPQVYEVPRPRRGAHRPGSADDVEDGVLSVRVWGSDALPRPNLNAAQGLARASTPRLLPGNPAFPDRIMTCKCQMSFGWDFAPRLRTSGIWDNVSLIETRAVFIRDVWVRGVPDGRVDVRLSLEASDARPIHAGLTTRGKNFENAVERFDFDLETAAGENYFQFQFQLDDVRLWNPWDRGAPNLYDLDLTLSDASRELDSTTITFGLRTIELAPNPGAPVDEPPWTFVVNGMPEFIRGANWVPADAIPGRLQRADYAALIHLARAANVNLLRVWGGGLREKRAFYDLCDEQGLLVWQEFPFSGAPGDSQLRDKEFLSFTRAECGSIVRALRNHPSLALWCGGNEFNTLLNGSLVETLRTTVAEFDGTRHFKPASPSPGEHHNWRVWHGQANTRDYGKDVAGFFGEFGLQAPPAAEALTRFLPARDLWKPAKGWAYHNAELKKLWRYAQAIRPRPSSLEEFVGASQAAQLRGLQVMIEHARRNKGRTGGVAFWQFNEPWPAICWSVLDYARSPKPAYFKIQELYNPVLISFDYPHRLYKAGATVQGGLWLINDTLIPVQGELRVDLNHVRVLSCRAVVEANAVTRASMLQVTLANGANALRAELVGDGRVISTNEYDLNYSDRGEIGWLAQRFSDIGARLMS